MLTRLPGGGEAGAAAADQAVTAEEDDPSANKTEQTSVGGAIAVHSKVGGGSRDGRRDHHFCGQVRADVRWGMTPQMKGREGESRPPALTRPQGGRGDHRLRGQVRTDVRGGCRPARSCQGGGEAGRRRRGRDKSSFGRLIMGNSLLPIRCAHFATEFLFWFINMF